MTDTAVASPAPARPVSPFLWSVRREVWEHRAVWLAPLIVAGMILFGLLVSAGHMRFGPRIEASPGKLAIMAAIPLAAFAAVLSVTYVIVAAFYALAALNAERRDRSVLFWKSLPVSDLATVGAKAFIPFVVAPAITLVVIVATQLLAYGIVRIGAASLGGAAEQAVAHAPVGTMLAFSCWAIFALALWYAPVWGWLLMVSAWAKRAAFLWAVGVPLGAAVFERIAVGSSFIGDFLHDRLFGLFDHAFAGPRDPGQGISLANIDLAGFFTSPGLWIGLALAAVFLAIAVWQRRRSAPL